MRNPRGAKRIICHRSSAQESHVQCAAGRINPAFFWLSGQRKSSHQMHLACDDFRSKSVEVMRSETQLSIFFLCGGEMLRGETRWTVSKSRVSQFRVQLSTHKHKKQEHLFLYILSYFTLLLLHRCLLEQMHYKTNIQQLHHFSSNFASRSLIFHLKWWKIRHLSCQILTVICMFAFKKG